MCSHCFCSYWRNAAETLFWFQLNLCWRLKKDDILCSKETQRLQKWTCTISPSSEHIVKWLGPLNSSSSSAFCLLSCGSIRTAGRRSPEPEFPAQTLLWRQHRPVPTAPAAHDEGTSPPSPQVSLWLSASPVYWMEKDQPDKNQLNLPLGILTYSHNVDSIKLSNSPKAQTLSGMLYFIGTSLQVPWAFVTQHTHVQKLTPPPPCPTQWSAHWLPTECENTAEWGQRALSAFLIPKHNLGVFKTSKMTEYFHFRHRGDVLWIQTWFLFACPGDPCRFVLISRWLSFQSKSNSS